MFDKKGYADELQERIKDFKECPYPKKVWFEIFNFLRAFRNGSVVYDLSVDGLGVVGYLYPSSDKYGEWKYDIILRPFESGKARCFADAQLMIARHLCENIPFSIKYPAIRFLALTLSTQMKTMSISSNSEKLSGLTLTV